MNKFEEYLEAVREAVLLQEGDQEYEYSEAKRKIGIARPEKYKGKVIDYGSFIAEVTMKLSDFARKNNIKIRYSEVGSESKGSEKVAMEYLDLKGNGKLYLDVNQENGNVVGYIIHALGGVQFSSGPHRTVEAMVKAVKNFVNKQPSMESFEQINEAKGDVTAFKAELKGKGIDLNFLKKDISVATIRDSGQPYVKIKGHATEYTNIDKFVKDIASKGYMNYNDAVKAVKSKGFRLPTIDEIKNMTGVKGGIGVGNGGVFWAQGGKAWNTLGNYPNGYVEVEANKNNILKVLYVDKSGKLGFYSDLPRSRSKMFT